MTDVNPAHLDDTGKVILDEIYNERTPAPYYTAIEQLDYKIPQLAKPVFTKILDLLEQQQNQPHLKLVDLGCSYGINATLLKWNLDLETVFQHYLNPSSKPLARQEQIQRDKDWLKSAEPRSLELVGVDISTNALEYSVEAGIIDAMVSGNFEHTTLTPAQTDRLRDTNLIISTGCIGYVTHKSLTALLDAIAPKRPWMAHFVLRMFSFDDVKNMASERGYETIQSRSPVRQRQFISKTEQRNVVERLAKMSIDTKGYEDDGWYYADFFLSRPSDDCRTPSPAGLRDLFDV